MSFDLTEQLHVREQEGLRRQRSIVVSPQSTHVTIDDRKYLSFCSNDYLSLANHPELVRAAYEGAQHYGVGAGASHLLNGHSIAHHALEEALAQFTGFSNALLFSTGYMANIGVVTALVGRSDTIFADKLNHASLNDAAVLSRAQLVRYPHLDLAALERRLAQSKARRKLIITDAVFSMDGDIAPVEALTYLCEKYHAMLVLDDAHGFGVLGSKGRGILFSTETAKQHSSNIIYMATLGKAGGVFGAFVAASNEVIETLIQSARSYIYTTASPPLLSHVLMKSLKLIEQGDWRRKKLMQHIQLLKEKLRTLSWPLLPSGTPIQPLVVGDVKEVMRVSQALKAQSILVPAIRPPTVPQGTARLRISLSADHQKADILAIGRRIAQNSGCLDNVRMAKQSIHIETLGNGPDLVLLHGWAMHSGVWKGIRDQLATRHRVHLFDLPGHGLSPPQEPGDFDHIVEIIQDELPEHCTICGWSLGGQVAMGLALANPLYVKKLVLVSTTPCFVKHSDWPWGMESKFLQFFMENLHQNFRTTINRFLTLQINGGRNSTSTLAQLREFFFERDQPDYIALQKGLLILQTNDMRSKLHRIDQPVLLLHGENDMITHPSAAEWMNRQLKNSRLVLFPKCGHAPFITDPDKFVACINEA